MLDKSVPYFNMLMRCPWFDVKRAAAPVLPEGYRFSTYRAGDIARWAALEHAVDEFPAPERAEAYFERVFLPFESLLPLRMNFVLDPSGRPVATATAWFLGEGDAHRALLHWVSCLPAEQGKGLGKAVVLRAMRASAALEPCRDMFLHTQTWSHKAVGMYNALGFRLLREETIDHHPNEFAKAVDALRGVMPEPYFTRMVETAE